jgi:hypothetical protein
MNPHIKLPDSFFQAAREFRCIKVQVINVSPPEISVRAAAVHETFFHVAPKHGTINLSPQKQLYLSVTSEVHTELIYELYQQIYCYC